MRWISFILLALCTACAQTTELSFDKSTHVERVIQDVTAMVEGMAAAHSERRVVLRSPEFRSSSPIVPPQTGP